MAIKTAVVVHNATTKKHEPLAAGDKLAGSLVQLSTDAGQSIALGTDGGLFVNAVVGLPDDQVLTGDNSGSVNLTLTPSTQPNGDVNYTIKGEVKIDPAAGNAAFATENGIYVPIQAGLTDVSDKQTEFGTQVSTADNNQTYQIIFATPFTSVPFITVSSAIQEDVLVWKARNVTTTGFLLEGNGGWSNGFIGDVNWKAEEK